MRYYGGYESVTINGPFSGEKTCFLAFLFKKTTNFVVLKNEREKRVNIYIYFMVKCTSVVLTIKLLKIKDV